MVRVFKRIVITFWACFAALLVQAQGTVLVPMSDAVQLVTDVYLPSSGGPVWPVILERTPYPRTNGSTWTSEGYVYVCQSVRGRFGSEGTFSPFADEGWGVHKDGVDTVAWIHQQSWCNGRIGTYGGSASACNGNLLGAASQALTFQVAQEGASKWDDHLTYQGGVFLKALVEGWLAAGVGTPDYANVWKANPPSATSYWSHYDAEARSTQVTSPGLFVGGWWDIFGRATVDNFMACQYHGGSGAKGNQKLLMRPTGHGPWGAQDLQMAPNYQQVGVTAYRRRFAKFWFGVANDGVMKEPAVTYYVVGDDTSFSGPGWEWRTSNNWPPFPPLTANYYFHQDGTLTTSASVGATDKRVYTYDPANPVSTLGGQNLTVSYGPYDQRPVSGRADVLKFATPPLTAPLETTGEFLVKLYVSSDAPDTDFTAKLVDVYPDGNPREILMLDSIQRVKYRNGYATPAAPLSPSDVVEVSINLGHISWVFNTNHRIGVQISSSNYPRFEVNPNNGQELPGQGLPSQVASNTVHMSPVFPSALVVPVRNTTLDSDGDGLTDEIEYNAGSSSSSNDTDGDGSLDQVEVAAGTNPANKDSYPGHVLLNVMDFGAVANGITDNTAPFTNAFSAASAAGGGVVTAPTGVFKFSGTLTIPADVTLEGIWRAPSRAVPYTGGTTLLATASQGNANGTPFITMQARSTLRGIAIYYPNQVMTNPPVAFPWTIRGAGNKVSLVNVMLVNPYKAVDLGTNAGDDHLVEGLYGQALYRGLYLDQSSGWRLENIHFWPFYDLGNAGTWTATRTNGIAFQFGNVRNGTALNLFSIFYKVGFEFDDFGHGAGSGTFTNMYPDIGSTGWQFNKVAADGVTVYNGLTMSTVEVGPNNTGPVTFRASGFMGSNNAVSNGFVTLYQANIQGTGPVTFDACHFGGWDEGTQKGQHCIIANAPSLVVTGCEFIDSRGDRKDIQLGALVRDAEIVGNRAENGFQVTNNTAAGANLQIGLNTEVTP